MKYLFYLFSLIFISISFSSCDSEKEINNEVVISQDETEPSAAIKLKVKHGSGCNYPIGFCIIVTFLENDTVEDDETTGTIVNVGSNQLKIYPDDVIWDTNGNVPVTYNLYLPNNLIGLLEIPSNSYIVSGTYTVDNPSLNPSVTVDISN